MKHSLKITGVLLFTFLLTQFIGITILLEYIDPVASLEQGETIFRETPFLEKPPVEETISFIPILIAILIGTGLLLLLIKFNLTWMWKFWFLIAVVITLAVAFNAFVGIWVAVFLALVFGIWKIFKPNVYVHNITELFVYGGLAAIFVPIFNLVSISILLVLIAIYDAYAVWKSKHMVTLAKSQTKAKVFAGLMIPYTMEMPFRRKVKKKIKPVPQVEVRTAVLGGGDMAFPLLFAGVVLKDFGLWQSLVIPVFAAIGLGLLLWKSQEKKFYPAMPFIAAGCFIGLGVVWLIQYLL